MEHLLPWFSLLSPLVFGVFAWLYSRNTANGDEVIKGFQVRLEDLSKSFIDAQNRSTEAVGKLTNVVNLLNQSVAHLDKDTVARHDGLMKIVDQLTHEIEQLRRKMHWIINRVGILKMTMEKNGTVFRDNWDPPV